MESSMPTAQNNQQTTNTETSSESSLLEQVGDAVVDKAAEVAVEGVGKALFHVVTKPIEAILDNL